jgi:hypothetical protein
MDDNATATYSGAISEAAILGDWRDLLAFGPRFTGSPAERAARDFVLSRLSGLALDVTTFGYDFPGWELLARPTFEVTEPEPVTMDALAFIYCAGTGEAGVEGELELLGSHRIIGCFDWTKFAINDDQGRLVGYVSVRPDGPAIPQPLHKGSAVVPHFILGAEHLRRLVDWADQGVRIRVRGTIQARYGYRGESANVIARYTPAAPPAFRLVLCGHLDSMYGCPGANDNGGGVVALLALARAVAAARLPFGVDLIWFTGEEWDLAGSRAYVKTLDDAAVGDIRLVLNLDGIAETAAELHVWSGNEDLECQLRTLIGAHQSTVPDRPVVRYTFPPKPGSDHVPFEQRGVPVVMFTGFEMCRYHSPEDTYRPEQGRNIANVASLVWNLVQALDPAGAAAPLFRGGVSYPVVGE